MAISLADQSPATSSVGASVSTPISFHLQASFGLSVDQASVVLKVGGVDAYKTVSGTTGFQTGFTGTADPDGAGGFLFNVQQAAKFLFNRPVTVLITGTSSPGPVPFVLSWSFTTTILTNFSPDSDTPPASPPSDTTAAVDQGVRFRINANSNPPTSQTINQASLGVVLDAVPAIVLGVIQPGFTGAINIDGQGGFTINVRDRVNNLPYSTIVQVDVSGSEQPLILGFSQSFNFQTVPPPVELDKVQAEALDEIAATYASVRDDGAEFLEVRKGVGILDADGTLTDTTTPDAFAPTDVGNAVFITGSGLGNNRSTRVKTFIPAFSPTKVRLADSPYVPEVGVFTYTLVRRRVSSTAQSTFSPPASISTQADNATNGIFLATQKWAEDLAGFRTELRAKDFDDPSVSPDWAVNVLAPSSTDPAHGALRTHKFDDTIVQGVGFQVGVPVGARGMDLRFVAKAATAPGVTSRVGLRLYFRRVPDGGAVAAWTSLALGDFTVPTDANYHYGTQVLLLSSFTPALIAGSVYQFELVRVAPTVGPNLGGDWHLLELLIDFG